MYSNQGLLELHYKPTSRSIKYKYYHSISKNVCVLKTEISQTIGHARCLPSKGLKILYAKDQ